MFFVQTQSNTHFVLCIIYCKRRFVMEAEQQAGKPHDHRACGEGNGHGGEDAGDNAESVAAVDVVADVLYELGIPDGYFSV